MIDPAGRHPLSIASAHPARNRHSSHPESRSLDDKKGGKEASGALREDQSDDAASCASLTRPLPCVQPGSEWRAKVAPRTVCGSSQRAPQVSRSTNEVGKPKALGLDPRVPVRRPRSRALVGWMCYRCVEKWKQSPTFESSF